MSEVVGGWWLVVEWGLNEGLPTASRGLGSPVKLSRAPTLKTPPEWPMASQVPPSRPGSRSMPARMDIHIFRD